MLLAIIFWRVSLYLYSLFKQNFFCTDPSKYSHMNPVLTGECNEIFLVLVVQGGISLPCKETELKAVRPYRVFIAGI